MKGFEKEQQIDIFNLDVLNKQSKMGYYETLRERQEDAKKRLYYTLKISHELDNVCSKCPINNRSVLECNGCVTLEAIRRNAKGLMALTDKKVHREEWYAKTTKKDDKAERLYTYETVKELEQDFSYSYILNKRREMSLIDISREIDSCYNALKSFVNKHKNRGL